MALRILCFLSLLTFSYAGVLPFLDPRIVNGRNAQVGEFPYQISLQEKNSSSHFCSGLILNENYVITVAHCVEGRTLNELKVAAGSVNLTHPKSQHNVVKIFIHEGYDPTNYWINDIALLKVQPPFVPSTTVGYVHVPPRDHVVKANDVAIVSGWGALWQGGPTTVNLQRVNIRIADQAYCKNKYNSLGYNIYPTQVCAHEPSTQKGVCKGDSGGPLTVGGILVGLVSWAHPMGCAIPNIPAVYTRVVCYLDWIATNVI